VGDYLPSQWVPLVRGLVVCVLAAAPNICTPIASVAATAPIAGPQATAEQIRAAHPGSAPALKLVFDRPGNGPAPSAITAIIAADFLEIITGKTETIYDFKLRRVIVFDSDARRFTNSSLYATVAFRVFERLNRSALSRALAAANVGPSLESMAFWDESELGIIDPRQTRPKIERQTDPGGALSFRYQGAEVVRFIPSAQNVAADDKARFARALRYIVRIHPAILDDILATGLIPATLTYTQVNGPTKSAVSLTLRSAERIDATFPLPADASVNVLGIAAGGGAALNEVVPQMLQAAAGKYASGPKSIRDYQMAIGDALQNRAPFQALLLEMELNLQHGPASVQCVNAPPVPRCYTLREVASLAAGDARTQAYIQAIQIESRDRNQAIALHQGIARDGLKDAVALDIGLANALSQSQKHNDALPLFLNAIRANPYVAAFYKDLGDHFQREYRMDVAWLFYDLGRGLPSADAGNLQYIDQLEQQLASQNPSLF
jgi:hypothetical protein